MKKIMNNVDAVENEMVLGMVKAYPQYIKKLDCGNVVVRARKKEGKVALISGGGSGHEPAHGGFVGECMLDAAVAGPVFTSPTPDQIYEGIKAIETDKGVFMVVKNYTGDDMNFEMAAEMAEMDVFQSNMLLRMMMLRFRTVCIQLGAVVWQEQFLYIK